MARHLEFKKVQYADIQDYLDDVAHAYAEEVGLGAPRNPDHANLRMASAAGALLCVAGYDEGTLAGVIVFAISNYLLDYEVKVGTEILFYVDPKHRHAGLAAGMLTMAERLLVDCGCDRIVMCSMQDNKIDKLLTGRGYSPAEQWFSKEVK